MLRQVRPRMPRRAFTLVEILTFAAVGSMVLYMMYDIFVASARQGQNLDRKLEAVQGAQLLMERLERDLKHLIYVKDKFELEVSEDGLQIFFYVFDGHGEDLSSGEIPIHMRDYTFDPATHRMLIDGVVFQSAFYRAVEFQLANAGGAGGSDRPVLTIRVGGVARDMANLPEEELDLRSRADFVSSVGLAAVAESKRQPYWRTNLVYQVR
jgi:hypothetical protein